MILFKQKIFLWFAFYKSLIIILFSLLHYYISMAYPWLKFVYNWADSKWIYVEIDDTKSNYFWPDMEAEDYEGNTRSFRDEEWDIWDANYTYNDYFERSEYYQLTNSKELKEDFLEYFENYIADALFEASKSFHSYSLIGPDYKEIYWYKNCIKCAKRDVDMDALIKGWNDNMLLMIRGDLESYYEYWGIEDNPEHWNYYMDRIIETIHECRDFNKVKYKNFNIKNYIESRKLENIDEIIEFIKNWKDYFN